MNTAGQCNPDTPDPPPKDPTRTQSTIQVSSLCLSGWQPLLITGFIIDMLRRMWCSSKNIVSPEMKQYLWQKNGGHGIVIDSVYRYDPTNVEKRPAVMVKRNSFKNLQLGLSAGQSMGTGFSAYENEVGAIQQYSVLFVGSHTLFCIHKTGAAVEILANEVLGQVVCATYPIRKHLNLRNFTVTDIGAVQMLAGEATENMVVPITLGWAYEYTYQLKEQSLPLQEISLTALLGDGAGVALSTPYVGP